MSQWHGSSFNTMPPGSYPPSFQFNGMSFYNRSATAQFPRAYGQATSQFSIPTGSFGHYGQPAHSPYAQANFAGYFGDVGPTLDPNMASTSTLAIGFSAPMMPSRYHGLGIPTGNMIGNPWYFDSGATSHVTNNLQHIAYPQSSSVPGGVQVGNGSQLQVTHSGSGVLSTPHTQFRLSHILHTPAITHNLLSVHQFSQDNNCILILTPMVLSFRTRSLTKFFTRGPAARVCILF